MDDKIDAYLKQAEKYYTSAIATMDDTEALVDTAISLDETSKTMKKLLDQIKAKLQKIAVDEIDNKNIKYVRYGGTIGNCEITQKTKFEIENYMKLVDVVNDKILIEDKITRKVEVKYDIENNFKKALIALYKGEYADNDLPSILANCLGLSDKALKLAQKKLKGEYAKDKELLESLGCTGELEEELDAIRAKKNIDLIRRYFDPEKLDIETLKKAIYLEDSVGVTLNRNEG